MTESLPTTQQAILQPDPQSTDVILIEDHPVPTPSPSSTEHLIRVHTTAITNGELLWTKNFPFAPPSKVLVPCFDIAGTVVTAPPSSPFQPGTEVYARGDYKRTGCARKYTILLTEEMAVRPHSLPWAESACVPMSAETAWQALFVHGGLEPEAGTGAKGKRVFVTAASGGVGVWVVQLAKWAGAEVVGTCSADNVDWVSSLGANEVLDYRKVDVKKWAAGEGKKVDLVVDCIGAQSLFSAWWAVKEQGLLISIFQPPEEAKPESVEGGIRTFFFVMESNGEQLQKVTELINQGIGKPSMDSVHPFEKFQDAFAKVEKGRPKGKVVLDLGAD